MKNFISCFLFLASCIYAQSLTFTKIPSFENFAHSIPEGEEVEVCVIDIPGDDLLCDEYSSSTGRTFLAIYRLKRSKKIFRISERGATSCNGDSDYRQLFLYDQDGNVVYFEAGGLFPMIQFYENGIATTAIFFPDEYATVTKTYIQKLTGGEKETAELKLDNLYADLQKRASELAGLKNLKKNFKEEADSIIRAINKALNDREEYTDQDLIIRKPKPIKNEGGELAYVNAVDIRVRSQPSVSSQVVGKVSYYDQYIEVLEIKGSDTIEGYGTHPWYKISFIDSKGKEITGWIFGAFIMNSVYEK